MIDGLRMGLIGVHRGNKPLGCLIRADACLAASHVSGFGLRRPEHLD